MSSFTGMTPTGWSKLGPGTVQIIPNTDAGLWGSPNYVPSGLYFLALHVVTIDMLYYANVGISQNLVLTSGRLYWLSFYVRYRDCCGTPVISPPLAIKVNNGTIWQQNTLPATWTYVTVTFTAPISAVTLSFIASSPGKDSSVLLDNIKLTYETSGIFV